MQYKTIEEIIDDLERNPIEAGGNIYHPIPFPEFEHLKTSSDKAEVYKKWNIIEKCLLEFVSNDFKSLKVLDVGANGGFYTFKLAQKGAKVVSFEPHPRYAPIGEYLARHSHVDVEWHGSSFDFKAVQGKEFDVVILLSVFQWMAAGGKKMKEATIDLNNISSICNYMIFELGYNKGKSHIKTKKLNHYAEIIRFLKNYTNYRYFKLLGTTKLWRAGRRYLVICSNDQRTNDSLFMRFVRDIKV
jgi:SAM-dependent methyltransferase